MFSLTFPKEYGYQVYCDQKVLRDMGSVVIHRGNLLGSGVIFTSDNYTKFITQSSLKNFI